MQNENSTEWLTDNKYGICRLSLVSVYQEPRPGSGLLTQLLFGETYEVKELTPDRKWLKISSYTDGTTGWIIFLQHEGLTEEEFSTYNEGDFQVTTSPVSTLKFRGGVVHLLLGSNLQVGSKELFDMKRTIKFEGKVRNYRKKANRGELLDIARSFLNVPFLSGGRSFFGVGSGSYIQLVFKICGYAVPKFISMLIESGKPVPQKEAQPGDVLVFANEKGIPHHAGIYLGDDRVIHVKGKVREDVVKWEGARSSKNNAHLYKVLEVRSLI